MILRFSIGNNSLINDDKAEPTRGNPVLLLRAWQPNICPDNVTLGFTNSNSTPEQQQQQQMLL
jgi:hypothetical protein